MCRNESDPNTGKAAELRQPNHCPAANIFRRLLIGWLTAVSLVFLSLPEENRSLAALDALKGMSLFWVILLTGILFGTLSALSLLPRWHRLEKWCLPVSFSLLAGPTLQSSYTWPYFCVCLLILLFLIGYAGADYFKRIQFKAKSPCLLITAAATVLFFLYLSIWGVYRIRCYGVPTYDFGLFAQMFHNMKTSGLPMTTLERDGLLSHFHVHMSPIFYLLLPFYWLVPTPETLPVLQAAVLALAVIPLWKLGKHHGLSEVQRMLLCIALLAYPVFSGGIGYDLHENCFLTLLILWLFYGLARKNLPVIAIFTILILCVKEDAAMYTAVIALWYIARALLKRHGTEKKDVLTGIGIFLVSVLWFLGVTCFLTTVGDGVMTYRYSNFFYEDSKSLVSVIKSVILLPMKALFECVDKEKLPYIYRSMLPLLALPLFTRHYERYILLIPYILINLMSDNKYQHDIFFQYSFGSTAFLIYLTLLNLSDIRSRLRKTVLLTCALSVCLAAFFFLIVPRAKQYPNLYEEHKERYTSISAVLDQIPEDASVAASTYYTTRLSKREVLYDLRYTTTKHVLECEYVVISLTGKFTAWEGQDNGNGMQKLIDVLKSYGYKETHQLPGILVVYHRNPPK